MRPNSPFNADVHVAADAFGRSTHPPLLIISGPPGADLQHAIGEALGRVGAARESRPKNVKFSFGEALSWSATADPGSVLVVRDLQTMSADALGAFENLVRQLRGTSSICICGVTLPLPPQSRNALVAVMHRLERDGLVSHLNVRPMSLARFDAFVAQELDATLDPDSLTSLRRLTRGWPATTSSVLESYRRAGMIRTVDRRAYLKGSLPAGVLEASLLTKAVGRMGTETWRVAKAVAVLGPLGDAAPRLIARALELTEQDVLLRLTRLEQAGVVKHRRTEGSWRFRLPVLATCLTELSGPYERRKLAQLAITALWDGTARCPDPWYLADQLVTAGAMVDRERARNELLSSAGRVAFTDGGRATTWLRAAAELAEDDAQRARILLIHARTCLARGDAALALASSTTLLASPDGAIPAQELPDVVFVHLAAMYRSGESSALEAVARGDRAPWHTSAVDPTVTRAFALALLGRWRESVGLLGDRALTGPGHDHVDRFRARAELWLGSSSRFTEVLTALPDRAGDGGPGLQEINDHVGALLVLAELDQADRLLAGTGVQLDLASRSIAATYRGDVDEALALTQKCIATSAPAGCDPTQTAMYQVSAALQLYRGRLTRAQELINAARERGPALPHLLAITEAFHDLVLGEVDKARTVLENALRQAADQGLLARTEGLWILLADIALQTGQTSLLPGHLRRIEHVARRMGTELAEINRLTLHALVTRDFSSAQAALQLVRQRDQPLERIVVLQRLVRYGMADPALLTEAYSLLGEMNALLSRSSVRTLMRHHNIAVPGRQEALAESERLLAVLVAESLSNRQIATVLGSSEKSVEGKLSRLFAKAGYQSRVELATAVLTGQFR